MVLKDFCVDFWKWYDNAVGKEERHITEENIFKINQRLQIEIVGDIETGLYHSRIEDISTEKMVIAMPMSKGYPVNVSRGSQLFGKIITNGAVYRFKSVVIDKRMHPLPVWIVSPPSDIKKVQQRAFVRIEIMLPLRLEFIDTEEQENDALNVITKDISGGGLRIVSKQPFKLNRRLKLHIELLEMGMVDAIGEIVRIEHPQPENPVYWVGIKFIHITEAHRSKIIKFIFKKQLEYRQKGL